MASNGVGGLTLRQYAGVQAGLRAEVPVERVLENEAVDAEIWSAGEPRWAVRLADDLGDEGQLHALYDVALLAAAQRYARRIDPLDTDLARWLDFVRHLSVAEEPLPWMRQLGLLASDVTRLHAYWAARFALEPALLRACAAEMARQPEALPPIVVGAVQMRPAGPPSGDAQLDVALSADDDDDDEADDEDPISSEAVHADVDDGDDPDAIFAAVPAARSPVPAPHAVAAPGAAHQLPPAPGLIPAVGEPLRSGIAFAHDTAEPWSSPWAAGAQASRSSPPPHPPSAPSFAAPASSSVMAGPPRPASAPTVPTAAFGSAPPVAPPPAGAPPLPSNGFPFRIDAESVPSKRMPHAGTRTSPPTPLPISVGVMPFRSVAPSAPAPGPPAASAAPPASATAPASASPPASATPLPSPSRLPAFAAAPTRDGVRAKLGGTAFAPEGMPIPKALPFTAPSVVEPQLSLEAHARLHGELAAQPHRSAEILAAHRLDSETKVRLDAAWRSRLAADAAQDAAWRATYLATLAANVVKR